ncbi:carboxymuconolactone decarboxylase family protein [Geosporobacter ferrireducens]|uniref:Carboxymuconolactone decarboxylase n=1 Tax=Geosporobacter ferrireducens TaxID=1424294 RepID=A0A1D8GMD8_9FIRM|nr:carboxymuconolactone decarboxylase family protein [Geosporobacter ferrireducens]AOT72057.1 carboxymuconolactone decarboxylase [Geosporobacter ferrireducens]MTI55941.1 carboxymuconolactone decarboxylase family protein [Geosporobacter ferrireducens]
MNNKNVSNSFQVFMKEAPAYSKAWMELVQKLDAANNLDEKTGEIAYVAVLAAVGLESGIPFHVKRAKELGATREEIKSAILIGLPAVGNKVVKGLPIALDAFDEM